MNEESGSNTGIPAAGESAEHEGLIDATLSLLTANLIGFLLAPIAAAVYGLPFVALWGIQKLIALNRDTWQVLILLAAFFLSIPIHELLHGVGFKAFAKISPGEVRYGMNWKYLTPYAHCRSAMAADAYRKAVLLPGVVLGVFPALLGLIMGSGLLVQYGFVMTIAAGGDVAILYAIRSVPGTQFVRDHPTLPGCHVYAGNPEPK